MTVWDAHGYKLVAYVENGEPWIKSVATECPGPECQGCKDRQRSKDLRSNEWHSKA